MAKDKKKTAGKKTASSKKRTVSPESKAALAAVIKEAKKLYKDGDAGITWQQALKKAGKKVSK